MGHCSARTVAYSVKMSTLPYIEQLSQLWFAWWYELYSVSSARHRERRRSHPHPLARDEASLACGCASSRSTQQGSTRWTRCPSASVVARCDTPQFPAPRVSTAPASSARCAARRQPPRCRRCVRFFHGVFGRAHWRPAVFWRLLVAAALLGSDL